MRKGREEEEPKPTVSPGLATLDTIFEQSSDNTFIVYDRPTGQISTSNLLIMDDTYAPLKRLPWPSVALPIPSSETDDGPAANKEQLIERLKARRFQGEYESEEQLVNEIKDFWKRHVELADDLRYDVYACFTLMTWRIEDFKVVPYLFFLGPMSSGKTRALGML